ncbi:MAG: hypothetical protein E7416_04170 [Ruminococcaceae bacterium]|nr:hypothetical protein [Oscillospiraceae bacterium]
MISCSHAHNLINSYIDGLLNESDCNAFEEHISCCEKCHEQYDILKSMTVNLADTKVPLPRDFAKKMHIALVKHQVTKTEEKKKVFTFPYMKFATVATAAIMIAVVGKYGVYDIYKDITNETMKTATESAPVGNSSEGVYTDSASEKDENNIVTEKSTEYENNVISAPVKANVAENKIPTESANNVTTESSQPRSVPTVEKDMVATSVPSTENTVAETQVEQAINEVPYMMTRMAPGDAQTDSAAVVENGTDVAAFSGAGGETPAQVTVEDVIAEAENVTEAPAAKDAGSIESASGGGADNETVEITTESATDMTDEAVAEEDSAPKSFLPTDSTNPTPTIVEINKSGDGNMLVFKNYLYTFLDSSEIAESDGELTITIGADEYATVINKIAANEYIKSIIVGNTGNGKAVIIIR